MGTIAWFNAYTLATYNDEDAVMIQLVYVSSSVRLFTKDELIGILEVSRTHNQSKGITGILLYANGNFLQLLEGEKKDVDALYEKITQDKRHRGCIKLFAKDATSRLFPDWSMGFRELSKDECDTKKGYSDLMAFWNNPMDLKNNPNQLLRILGEFSMNNR
ncbi:BLUF domain protein [Magnetococcus marinus MC-1]|uniref:BLUF domain protein n=2 Tax=Magnetococcus TaxID=162171 RepID=A0LAQ1_MAGMM|nr:BLUF domain protein [Magnetococcus marinus MC-1]